MSLSLFFLQCTPDVTKFVREQQDKALKAINDSSVIAAGVAIGMGVVMVIMLLIVLYFRIEIKKESPTVLFP